MPTAAVTHCIARPAARPPRRQLECLTRHHPGRPAVEAFIAGVYRDHYGARVSHWAPTLATMRADGQLVAAAGYRGADDPLYLEHYLDARVEQAIAKLTGHRVERHQVVEVGHFASVRPGEGRRLLLLLAQHLAQAGFRWVVSTATRELRELLIHVGLTPFALAPADPSRLPEGANQWGTYYGHQPVVVAGDLALGLAALEKRGRA